MGRLIDEQDAYDVLSDYYHHSTDTQHAALREALGKVESVDAIPVVRCKDCKWHQSDADKWCGYFECMGFEPDDYCSQGERKGGDEHEVD